MEAGKLRHRVTIQSYTATRGANGEEVRTWSTFATVSASIEPLSGQELLVARETMAEVSTRIGLRYLAGVTPKMRVVHGDAIYAITDVIDPELRHIELELLGTSSATAS